MDAADTAPALPVEDEAAIRAQTRTLLSGRASSIAQQSLITVLQVLQQEFGYLPRAGLKEAADHLGISAARVYGVATFYNQFRFTPPGRHEVKVCLGTACAIKRGGVILDSWSRKLGIGEGEVTPDREYSLERVACVGCCSMAPVTVIGEEVFGSMQPTKVDGILLQHELQRQKEDG